MEFKNRLYELRKKSGMSQEELAGRLHVARQTVSKWELGETVPDMEKLAALGALFEVSLDELVFGKTAAAAEHQPEKEKPGILDRIMDWGTSPENAGTVKRIGKGLKGIGIVLGILVAVDLISMVVYFLLYGVPK